MSQVYDITREDLVLRKFFEDSIIQNRIASHLDKDFFDDPITKNICSYILRYQKKYNKYPSSQELITALPRSVERTKLIEICNIAVPEMEPTFIMDMVQNFFKEKKTELVLINAAEAIHAKNFDNIGELVKELQEAVNFSLDVNIGLHVVEDTPEALERLNKTMTAIPSAISDIRSHTCTGNNHGGHYRKALTIYLGMPNVGKSIVLCNDAAYAYRAGYNVLYITLELAEELVWERIACNVADIELKNIRGSDPEELQDLLKRNHIPEAEGVGHLYVKSLPTSATVVDIENEIIEIKRSKGIDIDMLVVDYIGIMKPAKRAGSVKDQTLYTQGKEIAEQLRDLGKQRAIAVVTASQLRRDGYENKEAGMKDVAGSAGLNDTADLMITITQDALLKSNKMFLHMILKNRFGPNGVMFFSECDYDHMRVSTISPQRAEIYNNMQLNQEQQTPPPPSYNQQMNVVNEREPKKSETKGKAKKSEADKKPVGEVDVY